MGESMSRLFVDVSTLPQDGYGFFQLCFLGAVYGYVLKVASSLISDGSELLLLVPAVSGIVGSIILPILGAVPDGAIVLFSGLGPREEVQSNVAVGVGALAGSTIMLLTVPWFLTIYAGRVSLRNGVADYAARPRLAAGTDSGVGPDYSSVSRAAVIMLITAVGYLIVQGPSFRSMSAPQAELNEPLATYVHPYAMVGLVFCIVAFVGYLWVSYRKGATVGVSEKILLKQQAAIAEGLLSLGTIVASSANMLAIPGAKVAVSDISDGESTGLDPATARSRKITRQVREMVKPLFRRYDLDGSGKLDITELSLLIRDLHVVSTRQEIEALASSMDTDKDGEVSLPEFAEKMSTILIAREDGHGLSLSPSAAATLGKEPPGDAEAAGGEAEGDEEEEEMPEDIAALPAEKQMTRVIGRSLWMMGLGTALVLLFADPMVAVLGELGENRLKIGSFYVAFVLAPLASNLSEVIASYAYAAKKTSKSATIAFETLLGAAVMNNTFCLAIFLALIYMRGLPWVYTAETLAILFAEVCVFVVAMRRTQTMFHAGVVLCIFPASLVIVWVLENIVGWN